MKTTRYLLEKHLLNRICYWKPNLWKNSSSNLLFTLQIGTTNLQFVDFLVVQHIDVLPNCFWRSIVSKQRTYSLFLSQLLISLGSRLVFQQFVNKVTPIKSGELFVRATFSHNIFFAIAINFSMDWKTPKVLAYRNHLCAKPNPGLDLYTDISLCYPDDDACILLDLSLLKTFAQTFVEYEFLPFRTCAKQFDTYHYFLAHGKFCHFLVYRPKVVIIDVLASAI